MSDNGVPCQPYPRHERKPHELTSSAIVKSCYKFHLTFVNCSLWALWTQWDVCKNTSPLLKVRKRSSSKRTIPPPLTSIFLNSASGSWSWSSEQLSIALQSLLRVFGGGNAAIEARFGLWLGLWHFDPAHRHAPLKLLEELISNESKNIQLALAP